MRAMPPTWVNAELGEIVAPLSDGRTIHQGWSPQCLREPSESEEVWGVLKTTSIQPGQFLPEHNKRLPELTEARPLIEVSAGDLLITCAGPRSRCGVACLVRSTRRRLLMSGKMYRFRFDERYLDSRFVEAFLLSSEAWDAIDKMKTGGSDSGLNLTHERFRGLQIPIAPLAEQKRIVAAIEEAFSKLDAGEAGLQKVRQQLRHLRNTVLSAAVTGKLTDQLAEDVPIRTSIPLLGLTQVEDTMLEALPESWEWVTLGSVSEIAGGIQKQPKRAPNKNPVAFLRVANVGRGQLDLSQIHNIELFEGELARYGLRSGDLLVVEGNGSPEQIGRCALWSAQIEVCTHQNHLIRVRPKEYLLSKYLELFWNSPGGSRRVQNVASSTSGLHTLSTGKLKVLPVALPPVAEQIRIAAEVERQFSFIDAAERAVETGLLRSAALRRSILKAAFEGKLVPQDPTDEPASVLLERIRAERLASASTTPKRTRTKVSK